MTKAIKQILTAAVISAAVFVAAAFGLFQSADHALQDLRFSLGNRAPTGDIVMVSIDSRALDTIGVWPWPRRVHAELIDVLLDYGVDEIAFDVDFSSRSTPEDDAALAAALERAGGFVTLASFRQPVELADGRVVEAINAPLPAFAEHAWSAAVNVVADNDGVIRRFPRSVMIGGEATSSLPSVLAGMESEDLSSFLIDYSIDIESVEVISAADVLTGQVDPDRLRSKNVVIGAGATELRDNLVVPRFGIAYGPILQIAAAETLLLDRNLVQTGPGVTALLGLALCLGIVFLKRDYSGWAVLSFSFVGSFGLEIAAMVLFDRAGIVTETAGAHAASIALILAVMSREIDLRGLLARTKEREQAATQAILDRVIKDHFDGVVVVNQEGVILTASDPVARLLHNDGRLTGENVVAALPPVLAEAVMEVMRNPGAQQSYREPVEAMLAGPSSGSEFVIEFTISVSEVPGVDETTVERVACLTFRDITERTRHQAEVRFLADHDALTGALSRTRLATDICHFFENWRTDDVGVTLVLIDLDRFKNINESLGHGVGDEVLCQVVRRLEGLDGFCVSRLGADRFALAVPRVLTLEERVGFIKVLIEILSAPYVINEHRAVIGISVGLTDSNASGSDPETLIAHADMALAEAKEQPGNSHCFFHAEFDARVKQFQRLDVALREALERDEMRIVYQPQVDLQTGQHIGAEALMRWHNPLLGHVSPAQFIPLAEDSGLIMMLGSWAMRKACTDAVTWPSNCRVAVNVSALQFEYGDVLTEIDQALELSGLPPERLEVEITESVFIRKPESFIATLSQIRDRGVAVALDDFGMGYSSLGYLARLPVDTVKIDRSFIKDLPEDISSMAIVRSILTLCDALDLAVVAEGIETADQAWVLKLAGCQIGQGYHFGRPQSAAEIAEAFAGPLPIAVGGRG
ncbi:EAL domain-containing protein [Cucumibacter marinus]|uniref:EAL domain-containing protein n=1 Tax=Cucumibacter marinus TaxID=1121252 RepID=UPI000414E00B|nr:EAL domain-containing protein [Cucumibacter marinus]